MNRIQYMTELASLLQDIPEAERRDAMQYYNDYFDDAGEENEQQVIEELGSPAKVAENIKADYSGRSEEYGEYRETGYADTRFEDKNMPAGRGEYRQYSAPGQEKDQVPPRTSPVLKVLLIIAIIVVGIPVVIPVAFGIAAAVLIVVAALFLVFIALVVASVAVLISGVAVIGVGIAALIPELAVGLALIGSGLILGVLGAIATVASVRLCTIVFPGICRGIVWICRWPFHRRAVA